MKPTYFLREKKCCYTNAANLSMGPPPYKNESCQNGLHEKRFRTDYTRNQKNFDAQWWEPICHVWAGCERSLVRLIVDNWNRPCTNKWFTCFPTFAFNSRTNPSKQSIYDILWILRFLDMMTLARKLYPIDLTGQLKADQRLFSKYCYQAQDNKVNLTGKCE